VGRVRVFGWIKVDVIEVAREIVFVAQRMLPISAKCRARFYRRGWLRSVRLSVNRAKQRS
jgi:hypothetical protein